MIFDRTLWRRLIYVVDPIRLGCLCCIERTILLTLANKSILTNNAFQKLPYG